MSSSARPWFSLSTSPERSPAPDEASSSALGGSAEALDEATSEARRRIRSVLANGGRKLLLPQFVKEFRSVLHEQETVLKCIDTHPAWALPLLNRQYYALRSAADLLGLPNLSKVASRAEVLANLLDTGILSITHAYAHILVQTHALLVQLVTHVAKRGSDDGCYPIAKTASWMYALLDPAIGDYEPGPSKPPSHLQ